MDITQVENHLLKAIYRMSTARNKEDFKKGVSMIHAPGLNVMYGDAKGNIGWWLQRNFINLILM